MIRYKNCLDVSLDDIFKAFEDGFSDYIIKLSVTKEEFEGRFFGAEGNSKEYSFVVYDGRKPIGLMLGGMQMFDGIKTLRCGGLAIHPDYRGGWISRRLFQLHQEVAESKGCSQLFLEVIVGNDRAIAFYKKMGYSKIYDIFFYSNDSVGSLKKYHNKNLVIEPIFLDIYKEICSRYDGHVNWQNNFNYVSLSKDMHLYGAFMEDKLIGAVSVNKAGRISFIYVDKELRHRGIGSSLITHAARELDTNMITTSFVNNSKAFGFFIKNGFKKMSITQYEMYKIL